ncbi:MAG: EutN/CcmL family microcompartment protein [Planctomycetes bacterium]|nr:EutN/CcmL family microcompartment protein [Planctomycetota bacterium]
MILCRVTGTVVATQKHEHLRHNRILICHPVDLKKELTGSSFLALDVTDAGEGDLVLVNREGGAARILFNDMHIPLQAVVVGIVDGIDVDVDQACKARP